MTRSDMLLAIMAAADGHSYTPVQVQKAAFLITRNLPTLVNEGPPFNFVPYDYGPFDSAVYAEADRLQGQGLATVSQSPYGRWKDYRCTQEGLASGRQVLHATNANQRRYIQDVSVWVRSLSFSALVKSIYDAYPEMRANSIFQG